MTLLRSILVVLLLAAVPSMAQEEAFRQAGAAYDNGHFAEAVLLYQQLLDQGIDNPELHFNLGNACFKDGELPQAILHYRRAWYKTPRDPDIQANLRFALHAAGAVEPSSGITGRVLSSLSREEWVLLAGAAYVLVSLLLLAACFLRPARRTLLKWTLPPLALLAISAAGFHAWRQLVRQPECVVFKTGATALFGPMEGATAHFQLPLGALVRQRETDPKGWTEVEYDGKRGWLKDDLFERVSP